MIKIHFGNGESLYINSEADFAVCKNQLIGDGVDAESIEIDENSMREHHRREQTLRIRQNIEAAAGDIPSLLGTTADAAQLAIFGFASLVAKLNEAQSLADVRAAAAPFAALSADFLAKIESGEVKLPFMAKGTGAVIADIENRATAVTETLIAASGQDN